MVFDFLVSNVPNYKGTMKMNFSIFEGYLAWLIHEIPASQKLVWSLYLCSTYRQSQHTRIKSLSCSETCLKAYKKM